MLLQQRLGRNVKSARAQKLSRRRFLFDLANKPVVYSGGASPEFRTEIEFESGAEFFLFCLQALGMPG